MRIFSLHDSLNLNTGYATQMKNLIPPLVKYGYEWYTTDMFKPFGNPEILKNYSCIRLASGPYGTNNTYGSGLTRVVDRYNPDIVLVVDDIQKLFHKYAKCFLSRPWMAWFPKDNEEYIKEELSIIKRIPHPIVYAKFAKKFYSDHGIDVEHVYVPVDTKSYFPIRNAASFDTVLNERGGDIRKFISDDDILLTFVGRPNWRKNIQILLCVMSEIINRGYNNVKLYMHMDLNDKAGKEDLSKLIHGLGLRDLVYVPSKVDWDKGISKETLNIIYNRTDIYVSTHGGEGFGAPMAEALATETPVVATDYTTTREFVGEYMRGIAVPYDRKENSRGVARPLVSVEKFADAVCYLIDNESERKKMGKRGRKLVERKMAPNVVAGKMSVELQKFNCRRCYVQ